VGGVGQTLGQAGQGVGQTVGGLTSGLGQGGAGGAQDQPQANGQPTDGAQTAQGGGLAKEMAKLLAREIGHAASDEARDLGLAATRKVRELGERREQRRADKYNASEAAMRLADECGIDLAELEGSGRDGRITVNDVREAAEA
jgi:pyruvate/2-oxoglutarate dehydrogenase complex dihydrolipoamide acyltransferase (E2) component